MRGVPSSTPPLPPNSKHVKDARIPLPVAWRRCLQCCSMPRANGGVLSRVPSQGLRKKALGLSNMRRHCVWVKDDDCGTLAESAAAPTADRESVTSKQSGGLRGSRPDPVYNLDRQRAVAEKMQSRSAVIETAIIMILPAGVYAFRKYLVLGRLGEFCPSGINRMGLTKFRLWSRDPPTFCVVRSLHRSTLLFDCTEGRGSVILFALSRYLR